MKHSIVSKVFSILTFQRRFSIGVVRLLAGMFDALFSFSLKRHHGSTFHGTARLDSASSLTAQRSCTFLFFLPLAHVFDSEYACLLGIA